MIDFSKISKKNILIVGDVMLDMYYFGEVNRISPEAPVPVFRKKSEKSVLGGAANVASNMIAANQNVAIMSIVGNDENGKKLMSLLTNQNINTDLIYTNNRSTTTKVRFLADNNQQLLRLDIEDNENIAKEESSLLLRNLKEHIDRYDIILISDYMKGMLTFDLCQGVISLAKSKNIPVVIDVKDPDVTKYNGATLIKPNLNELKLLTGLSVKSDNEIVNASEILRKKVGSDYVLTTLGARGMVLVSEVEPYFVKSLAKDVYDVSGAGDTTIAYLATCLANNVSIFNSVNVANFAAGIQVSKVGTSSVSLQEVRNLMSHQTQDLNQKILNRDDIKMLRSNYDGKKIVFTNGCFDILHVGHKRYLQKAASLGDILVVGLNSDASVRRLKGLSRPINNEFDRAEMLSSLSFVDYVVVFEEDTPCELIKDVAPDILVKGGDYTLDQVVGKDIVESRGGKVELITFVDGKSTTNIINKIQTNDAGRIC